MSVDFKPRRLLFAFMNGSYKSVNSKTYDHKEWIVIEKADGLKTFINTANVKWIDELPDKDLNKAKIAYPNQEMPKAMLPGELKQY